MYSQSDPANPKSTNHLAESQLVDLLISGDVIAWRSFLEDYGRLIRWRISDVARSFGLASDTNSIDDATAHTIASLVANDHAALRTFQGRSSLGTYLTVIATRVATRDFARLRARMKKVHAASGTDGETPSLQDPALELLRSEEHQQLQLALNRLPEKQREVVRMFHLEGCSYMDISRTLQIPLGSVGVTLKRAEEKLRQILEPSQE